MKKAIGTFLEYVILALILGAFVYAFQWNTKQDIFIEDRAYYQKEISDIQEKLDKIQANTKMISDQLEIDIIEVTKQ